MRREPSQTRRGQPARTAILPVLVVAGLALAARGQVAATADAAVSAASEAEARASGVSAGTTNPVIRLKETVVTGTRQQAAVNHVPADVSVITAEDLRLPGIIGYQEALRDVPGVKINARQSGDIATPGVEVRGLESNPTSGGNVLVLLDGIPQRRLSFGGPYVGALPYDALTRMELVKGPESSVYGRGAMSGALQLFTDPGTPDWEVQTWNTYESTLNYGKSAWRVGGPLDSKSGATFSLTGSGSYTGGWQPRTDGASGNAYLHLRLPMSERDALTILAGYFDGSENAAAPVPLDAHGHRILGIARDGNLAVPDLNSLDLAEARAGLIWDRVWAAPVKSKLSLAYWNGDTDWKVGRPDDSSNPSAKTILNRPSSRRPWSEDYYFSELQLSQDYALSSEVHGTLMEGGNLEYSDYDNRQQNLWSPGSSATRGILLDRTTMQEPDPRTWIYGPWTERYTSEWDYGCFVKNDLRLWDRVTLDAGLRLDAYERHQQNLTRGIAATVHKRAVSVGTGLSYQLLKSEFNLLSVYGSWGQGWNPVFRSVGTTEIVNVNPETSQSYEAGLKAALLHDLIEATLAVYRQERNDVVVTLPSGQVANGGNWEIQGLELGATLRPLTGVTLSGNYTCRRPAIDEDNSAPSNNGNRIPFVAGDMLGLSIEYQHPSGVFGGLDDNYVGASFLDNANTVRLPSYHLVGAYAGYRYRKVQLSVFVKNLLDEEYYASVFNSAKYYAFEGLPRSVGVTFSAKF